MLDNNAIVFPCIEVRQPIGTFYIGAMDASDLVFVSYTDMRSIKEGTPRDVEEFSGIQRPLSDSRVKELQKYVTTVDASFPTSIILHISSDNAEYTPKGAMRVARSQEVAKIIDGQHRIAGLAGYKGEPFQLNVTIFIDMDPEDQALLFATINLKQTKVNKSLAYDLFDFAQTRSPQKTAHGIARLLNAKNGSPFFHKIKILGTASEGRIETLTQASVVYRLLKYITNDEMADRDAIKRGGTLPTTSIKDQQRLIFRERFRRDHDAEIARIVWDYFAAVEARWPQAWRGDQKGVILSRTTGFSALMRFLRPVYLNWKDRESPPTREYFDQVFEGIPLGDTDFTSERYLPGSSGEAALYSDLLRLSGLNEA